MARHIYSSSKTSALAGKPRQRALLSLGRLDRLEESGQLEAIIRSAARFSKKMIDLTAHDKGETTSVSTKRIGPGLIFERLKFSRQ